MLKLKKNDRETESLNLWQFNAQRFFVSAGCGYLAQKNDGLKIKMFNVTIKS
jgi:hypothetical protein